MRHRHIAAALAALLLSLGGLWAEDKTEVATNAPPGGKKAGEAKAGEGKGDEAKKEPKEPKDQLSETTNSVTINGVEVKYKATAGTIVIKDEEGKPHVSFFFIAYTRLDATNAAERPVTFSFNGGPGSSSVWLHLGLLGPGAFSSRKTAGCRRRPSVLSIMMSRCWTNPTWSSSTRSAPASPAPCPAEDAGKYHGVDQDLPSVGDFIRLYTTRYNRWASPKFLIGESYGTTRAAGLSGYLENRYGMYLNGIVLVSSVLDFETISFNAGQRSALHPLSADRDGDGVVSQEARARSASGREEGAGGGGKVRPGRLQPRPDARGGAVRRRNAPPSSRNWRG